MDAELLIRQYDLSSTDTIASVLEVFPQDYQSVDINEIPLSTRASNCVNNNSVKTYADLLKTSFLDIKNWRSCGRGTSIELLENCISIVEKYKPSVLRTGQEVNNLIKELSNFCNTCQDEDVLIDMLKEILSLFPLEYSDRPHYESFIREYSASKTKTKEAIGNVSFSVAVKGLSALSFMHGFQYAYPSIEMNESSLKAMTLADCEKTQFLDELDDAQSQNWLAFSCWVNKDIDAEIKELSHVDKDERNQQIFLAMASGKTLEEVGQDFGITRERVRQILEKRLSKVRTSLIGSDTVFWLYSYFDEEKTIHIHELRKILDDESYNVICLMLKKKVFDVEGKWHYDDEFDSLVFDFAGQSNLATIKPAIEALPNIINTHDMDEYILEIVEETKCSLDLIVREIGKCFFQYKNFYSKKKFTFFDMCDYVLKEYFQYGFKPSDENDLELFRNYMNDVFGYDSSQLTAQRMHSAMCEVGTLCGRGTFRHSSSFEVSDQIKDTIKNTIADLFNSGRTALSFNELFSKLSDEALSSGIEDSYVLHGVISNMELPYSLTQFYVLLDPTSSFENDFTDYVRQNYPISKKKVTQHFGLTDPQFLSVVERCKHVKQLENTLVYSSH